MSLIQDNKLIRSLLQNVKAGNNASFEQLYQIYSGRIFTLCFRLLGNASLAEEITKTIFITAWEQISLIRADVSFGSWVLGIAVFNVLEKLRSSGNFQTADDKNFKQKIDKKNYSISDFENGILTLPQMQRLVYVLNVIEKYSEEETADLLLMKKEEIRNLLNDAQVKMNALQNLIQSSDSIENQSETFSIIMPNKEVWKSIYAVINNVQLKKNKTSPNGEPATTDTSEQVIQQEKKEKKFGFFSWKKK